MLPKIPKMKLTFLVHREVLPVVPVEIKHKLLTGWAELTFLKRTIFAQANHIIKFF